MQYVLFIRGLLKNKKTKNTLTFYFQSSFLGLSASSQLTLTACQLRLRSGASAVGADAPLHKEAMHHPFNSNKSRHKPSVCGTSRGCSPRSGSRGRGRPSSRTPPRTRLSELDLGRRTRPGGGESVSGSKLAPSDSSHKHRRAADVLAAAGFGTIMTLQDDLTTAAAKGNAAEVQRCLSAGAEVNGRNRFGRTAVQVSALLH